MDDGTIKDENLSAIKLKIRNLGAISSLAGSTYWRQPYTCNLFQLIQHELNP